MKGLPPLSPTRSFWTTSPIPHGKATALTAKSNGCCSPRLAKAGGCILSVNTRHRENKHLPTTPDLLPQAVQFRGFPRGRCLSVALPKETFYPHLHTNLKTNRLLARQAFRRSSGDGYAPPPKQTRAQTSTLLRSKWWLPWFPRMRFCNSQGLQNTFPDIPRALVWHHRRRKAKSGAAHENVRKLWGNFIRISATIKKKILVFYRSWYSRYNGRKFERCLK